MANNTNLITLEQPIFSSIIMKDFLIVAAGGGGQKFAVPNALLSFRINQNGTIASQPAFNQQFEKEIPVWIHSHCAYNMFLVCMDNLIVFFVLNENDGSFSEIYRIRAMEFFDFDLYQNCCVLSKSGKFLACGTSDGNLKIYNIQINSQGKIENHRLLKDFQAHTRDINNIIIIEEKNILITCSSDTTCKIFELNSLRSLGKLTFRLHKSEKKAYLFRNMILDEKRNLLYTTQAPLTGDCYVTKWNVNDGFKPIDSARIGNVSSSSIDLDYNSSTLAIGDNKGSVVYVDSGSLEKNREINISELTVKTVKYYKGRLITGCADNCIRFLDNYTKGVFTLMNFIKILLIAFIMNIGLLVHKEKKIITFSGIKS